MIRLAFVLLLVAASAFAQNGSVRSDVDARKIGVEDVVTLQVVLEGDAASLDVALPSLKNLRVAAGPSTSTQISFINGSMSRQKTLSFVLRPERTGSAEVGPVSVQGYPPTAAINIDVVQGAIRPAQPQDPFGGDPFGGGNPFDEIFGRPQRREPRTQGKLFVEAVLSRPAARVGEPILVTYYVYTQISLTGVEFAEAPKYPGFWAEEIERSRDDSSGENTVVQGEPYLRFPVLERVLFPTRPGLLEIPEARLRLVPRGSFGVAAPIERGTRVLKVKVDSLPAGTPEDSAVGSYQVQASTDRNNVVLGDALTFRFQVKGRGNLKWIDAAPRLFIEGARVFPPRVISDLKTTRQGIEGSKTWEFVIVPEKAGSYEIPSISFPYFDPQAQVAKTESTSVIPIVVSASTATGSPEAPKRPTGAISLRADLDEAQTDFVPMAASFAFLSLAAQAYAWRRRPTSAVAHGRNKSAIQAALGELRDAALLVGTKERAATRIQGDIESVFGPRSEWPSDDSGDRLRSLADDLEFLRFAPQLGSYDAKLREVRDRAVAILEALR